MKFDVEVFRLHLVYEVYRPIRKFAVEVFRIHLVYELYRPITNFPVEVVRIHLVFENYRRSQNALPPGVSAVPPDFEIHRGYLLDTSGV